MSTKSIFQTAALALAFLSTLNFQLSTVFAQGNLTPPGAPAPTMKSLDQIEPRTPISSVPFTISLSGSYYVTSNLTAGVNQSGILVAADNVTLDLNGFTLSGTGGTVGEGVSTSGPRVNIVVRNGTVRNWPGSGVNFYDSGASQTLVQNIQSISNVFTGVAVKNSSRVLDCFTVGNGTRGIVVDNECLVEHCKVSGNVYAGIGAGANSELRNNQITGNGIGLNLTGAGNIVANNMVKANADNYSMAQGNQLDLLLCEVPESIDWPARVKLAGSLNVTVSNAVTITANNVTLDLNGFTISSTFANSLNGGTAILLANASGNSDITIFNGFISGGVTYSGGYYTGPGFAYGIYYSSTPPRSVRVTGVSVSGCALDGIDLYANIYLNPGNSTIVESCTVQTTGGCGIIATAVSHSTAYLCGRSAIVADIVSDSYGYGSGTGTDGIDCSSASNCSGYSAANGDGVNCVSANNCYGFSGGAYGVYALSANNCFGQSSSGYPGIGASIAIGCFGQSSSGAGIQAGIANSCYSSGGNSAITHAYNMP